VNLKRAPPAADPGSVNVILVPALILLIGLVVYKKVVEPRRAGGGPKSAKPGKAPKAGKGPKAGKPPKAGKAPKPGKAPKERARPTVTSGRMGSVL
jgi:hypothetical protein